MSRLYVYEMKPVKSELLKQQLIAAIGVNLVSLTTGGDIRVEVVDADNNEATVAGVVAAHDASVLTVEDKLEAADTVSRGQVRDYLRRQLTNASPDVAAVKAQAETYISGNVELNTALTNVASLYGYSLATDVGYLRAALALIALMG